MEAREVFRNNFRRPPILLGFGELGLLFLIASLKPTFAVTYAKVVVPSLTNLNMPVGEVGIDADLIKHDVIAKTQFQFRIMRAASCRVLNTVDAGQLILSLMLHTIKQRYAVHRFTA